MVVTVSILIPCYNAEPYLEGAIASALEQAADEVIVLDDGSTDRSLEIARSFEPQISVKTQSNAGVQITRNRLFELASGGWLQYLDADDRLYPGKIAQQLAVVTDDLTIPYCDFDIDRGTQFPAPEYPFQIEPWEHRLLLLHALCQWAYLPQTNVFLFPRQAIAQCPWRSDVNSCHEFRLIFDLMQAGYKFLHTPFFGFRYHKAWKPQQNAIALPMTGNQQKCPEQRLRDREALQLQVWAYARELELSEYQDSIEIGQRKLQADWDHLKSRKRESREIANPPGMFERS